MEKMLKKISPVDQVQELAEEIEKNIKAQAYSEITYKNAKKEPVFKVDIIDKDNVEILLLKQSDVNILLNYIEFYLSRKYTPLYKINTKVSLYTREDNLNRELKIFELTENKDLTIYKYNSNPGISQFFEDNKTFTENINYNNIKLNTVHISNNNSITEFIRNGKILSVSKLEYINDNIYFKYIYDNKKQKFNKMTFNSTSEENLKIEIYNLLGASKDIKQLRDSSNNWQTELIKKITEAATAIIENNITLDINKITSKEEYIIGRNLGYYGYFKYVDYDKVINFSKEHTDENCKMRLNSNLKTDNINFVVELENNYAFVSIDEAQITSVQLANIITELKENLSVNEILIYAKIEKSSASVEARIQKKDNTIQIKKDKILVRDKKAFIKLSNQAKLILTSRATYNDIEYLHEKEITE